MKVTFVKLKNSNLCIDDVRSKSLSLSLFLLLSFFLCFNAGCTAKAFDRPRRLSKKGCSKRVLVPLEEEEDEEDHARGLI